MAYSSILKPTDYFNTVLYTGNGSARTISGVGFQPDWVWVKDRTTTNYHYLYDSVRGNNLNLFSNDTSAEVNVTTGQNGGGIGSQASDGFTIVAGNINTNNVNTSSNTYVSWNWKAGTSFTNDASATGIGTLDSSGSVNTDAGFSIISFTGTETSSQSVAHGLGAVPELIISKSRDVADNWMVYHGTYSSQQYQSLNLTTAVASSANIWTSLPTSTVINIGDNAGVNDNGAMIMYAFRSVQGYSKFGSYTGNGSADGTFVYTGFKPAFVIIKITSGTGNWNIFDIKRDGYNGENENLSANLSDAESAGNNRIDILSNGFKVRASTADVGSSGASYIYMAIAENPFVASNFNAATAR